MRNLLCDAASSWPANSTSALSIKQSWFLRGEFYTEMLVGAACGHAPSRGAIEKAYLNQVRLYYLFYRVLLFVNGGGDGAESDGASIKLLYDCHKELAVNFVQAEGV